MTLSLDDASLRDVRHADPRTTRRYDKNSNSLNSHPTHRLLGASSRSRQRCASSPKPPQAPYPVGKMTARKRTPRTFSIDAQTLTRWSSRGLLLARELHSDQLRPGCEDAAPPVGVGSAPMLVCDSDDLVAVRARPVD
jgi:hypothetical protein